MTENHTAQTTTPVIYGLDAREGVFEMIPCDSIENAKIISNNRDWKRNAYVCSVSIYFDPRPNSASVDKDLRIFMDDDGKCLSRKGIGDVTWELKHLVDDRIEDSIYEVRGWNNSRDCRRYVYVNEQGVHMLGRTPKEAYKAIALLREGGQ